MNNIQQIQSCDPFCYYFYLFMTCTYKQYAYKELGYHSDKTKIMSVRSYYATHLQHASCDNHIAYEEYIYSLTSQYNKLCVGNDINQNTMLAIQEPIAFTLFILLQDAILIILYNFNSYGPRLLQYVHCLVFYINPELFSLRRILHVSSAVCILCLVVYHVKIRSLKGTCTKVTKMSLS